MLINKYIKRLEKNNIYYNGFLVLCSTYSTPPYNNDNNYYLHFWRFLDFAHAALEKNKDLNGSMVVLLVPFGAYWCP